MNTTKKQLLDIINNHKDISIEHFIEKKITTKIFKYKNREEIVNLLPIIIPHTNYYNSEWLNLIEPYFFKTRETAESFIEFFIDNLNNLNFQSDKYNNSFLIDRIITSIFSLKPKPNQIKKLINNILKIDFNLEYRDILTNLTYIIEEKEPKLISYMLNTYLKDERTCNLIIKIMFSKEIYPNLILENLDSILKEEHLDLLLLKENIINNPKAIEKINTTIQTNPQKYLIRSLTKICTDFIKIKLNELNTTEVKTFNTILEIIYLIMEDICKNEHIPLSNIQILNNGNFSTVLQIGNKVLKIGYPRATKTFPNNPYISAILLRKEFFINKNNSIFIEVNEKSNTKTKITKKELYQLYKNLRELHLIWIDIAERNVARLTRANKIYWREELPITDQKLGLEPYRGNIILQKGDLIIIDNDLIFTENDPEIFFYNCKLQKEFENKYQSENKLKRILKKT